MPRLSIQQTLTIVIASLLCPFSLADSTVLTCPTVNLKYACPIHIGDDPNPFRMIFDTGAAETWVHSKLHSSEGSSSNMDVHQYSPQSPAIVRKGDNQAETYRATYASNGITSSGEVVTDKIQLNDFTLDKVAFGAARFVEGHWNNLDGLLGFAFKNPKYANDLSNHDPVYQEIWKQKNVDDACFGVDASDPKQAQIQIGKQDPSKYQSDHAWKINVDITEGHWTAPKVQFYVGSTEIGSGAQNVVIDTGAGIYLPQDVASGYWAKVAPDAQRSVDGDFQVKCDTDLPDLQIQFGSDDSTKANLQGRYLKVKYKDSDSTGWCNGGIQAGSESLLGGRFFSGLYAEHCTSHPQGQYIQLGYHANENDDFIVEVDRDLPTNNDSEFEEDSESEGDGEDDPGPEEDVPDPDNPWDEAPDPAPAAAAVAAVSGASTTTSIAAAMAAGIAAAAVAIGLGVGLGTTHTDYASIPPVTSKSTGARKLAGSNMTANTGYGSAIPNGTFYKLLDQAQDDFNNAEGPSITKSYYNITSDIYSFRYVPNKGHEQDAVDAYDGVLSLLQWFRADGMSNLFTWSIYESTPMCGTAAVSILLANSTLPATFGNNC